MPHTVTVGQVVRVYMPKGGYRVGVVERLHRDGTLTVVLRTASGGKKHVRVKKAHEVQKNPGPRRNPGGKKQRQRGVRKYGTSGRWKQPEIETLYAHAPPGVRHARELAWAADARRMGELNMRRKDRFPVEGARLLHARALEKARAARAERGAGLPNPDTGEGMPRVLVQDFGPVKIDGKHYKNMRIEKSDLRSEYPKLADDMVARGWEPANYYAIGPKGALWLLMRGAKYGNYSSVMRMPRTADGGRRLGGRVNPGKRKQTAADRQHAKDLRSHEARLKRLAKEKAALDRKIAAIDRRFARSEGGWGTFEPDKPKPTARNPGAATERNRDYHLAVHESWNQLRRETDPQRWGAVKQEDGTWLLPDSVDWNAYTASNSKAHVAHSRRVRAARTRYGMQHPVGE